MPFNGSGIYEPISAPDFPAIPLTTIRAAQYNAEILDIAQALGQCLTRTGEGPALANIPMGGFQFTGLGVPSAAGQALVFGQDATVANLAISGSGKRITGDFSNATVINRMMFQSSTVNGNTTLGLIPNGTSVSTGVNLYSNADPANSSLGSLLMLPAEVRVQSGAVGTGTYLPMTFYTGGAERLGIDTAGNVGIGTVPARPLHIKSNSTSYIARIENTISTLSLLEFKDSTTTADYKVEFGCSGDSAVIYAGGALTLNVGASGSVLVVRPAGLGYGTGAGGTVTQATSKSTGVTLNKPCGQISMHAASLAAGATAWFILSNTAIADTDVVLVNVGPSPGTGISYQAWVSWSAVGQAYIQVKNTTAGTLSDAVLLNFAVIKGVIS